MTTLAVPHICAMAKSAASQHTIAVADAGAAAIGQQNGARHKEGMRRNLIYTRVNMNVCSTFFLFRGSLQM